MISISKICVMKLAEAGDGIGLMGIIELIVLLVLL